MIHVKSFLFACILVMGLVINVRAFARGGDMVNNGGGIAEKNILYAYDKLDKYIRLCLNSDSCRLNGYQKFVLKEILSNLSREKINPSQLSFSSEKLNPGTFIIDGIVRVAKTGSTVGSPILINSDLLYSKNETSDVPVSIPEAVAILIHEMGHHVANHLSHEELDLIGVRASMLLQQKIISTPLVPWVSDISLSVYNSDLTTSFPEILLAVGNDVVDVSDLYDRTALCYNITIPIPILPIPDIQLISKRPVASILHNVHWEQFKDDGEVLRARVVGNVSNNCIYKIETGTLRINDYKMAIEFVAYKLNSKWIVDKNSIKMNQFRDPWYKIIKLPFKPI